MHCRLSLSFLPLSLYASFSLAERIPPNHILWGEGGPAGATLLPITKTSSRPAPIKERDTVCTNSPSSRDCWADGYDLVTDYDVKWPTTNKIVTVSAFPRPPKLAGEGHVPSLSQSISTILRSLIQHATLMVKQMSLA